MRNRRDVFPSQLMNPICEQAGCTDEEASKHAWKWEVKRWHSHPPQSFVSWWEPFEFDQVSGAHVGGHMDARRKWARKDSGRYTHKWYGTSTVNAWNTDIYVQEFDAWQSAGSPEPDQPVISLAAPLEKQRDFWSGLKSIISMIGKEIPKPEPFDYDKPKTGARLEY